MLTLAIAACPPALAYVSFSSSFQAYEQSPVLVVGKVIEIQLGAVVSEPDISSTRDVREATATIEVLRSRSSSDDLSAPRVGERMLLRIYRHVDGQSRSMYGPSLPKVDEDRVYVFPLRAREGALWRLVNDVGELSILHAGAMPKENGQTPPTSRDWLLDEVVGVLAYGAAVDIRDIARNLHDFIRTGWAPDLFPRLQAAIGNDPTRLAFLQVLYSFGQPHFRGPEGSAAEPPLNVVKWASERLARYPDRAQLLAATLLENMELSYWASPLLEVADHSQLNAGLRQALQEKRPGALYLASEMVRANHTELLHTAMARAFEIADDPSGDDRELQVAGRLVSERGSEAELRTYAALVRMHREADLAFYNRLWQSVGLSSNANARYVLAVVLEDRRIAHSDFQHADLAAWALQRQTGEDFGMQADASRFVRDRAIERARTWLRERGYTQ